MIIDRAVSIADLQRMAKKRLPRMAYDFIEGGCDDELGIAENEAAFGNYRLAPRYLVDVSQRDMVTKIAGQTYAIPLGNSTHRYRGNVLPRRRQIARQ